MIDFSTAKAITIPEGRVKKITRKSDSVVLWEKVTSRIPSEYQEVEYVTKQLGVNSYINLGFAFDTEATIYISYKKDIANRSLYLFGAAENSGKLRCMISDMASITAYGSSGSAYIGQTIASTAERRDLKYVLKQGHIQVEDTRSGVISGIGTSQATYTMTNNLALFAQNYNGSVRFNGYCELFYFAYYDKNDTLICELVPCYRKSDGEIGVYDVVRNIFLVNVGTGVFAKGSDV